MLRGDSSVCSEWPATTGPLEQDHFNPEPHPKLRTFGRSSPLLIGLCPGCRVCKQLSRKVEATCWLYSSHFTKHVHQATVSTNRSSNFFVGGYLRCLSRTNWLYGCTTRLIGSVRFWYDHCRPQRYSGVSGVGLIETRTVNLLAGGWSLYLWRHPHPAHPTNMHCSLFHREETTWASLFNACESHTRVWVDDQRTQPQEWNGLGPSWHPPLSIQWRGSSPWMAYRLQPIVKRN